MTYVGKHDTTETTHRSKTGENLHEQSFSQHILPLSQSTPNAVVSLGTANTSATSLQDILGQGRQSLFVMFNKSVESGKVRLNP